MSEPIASIVIESETDEFQVTAVEAVVPTWRDVWAIIRGRYPALVRKTTQLTVKGTDRLLRQVYLPDLADALNQPGPLTRLLEERDG